jgi:NADH-quinone oxidoreductase subunit E
MSAVATRSAPKLRPKLRKIVYQRDPLAEPPAADLQEILQAFHGRRDTVVSLLQQVQERYGHLPIRALQYASRDLGIPLSRIYGVATFYNQFQFSPPVRYVIQVCRDTACYVAGSARLLASMEAVLGIKQDESTPDRLFSLRTVPCRGLCSLAPVIVVGQDVHGKIDPDRAGSVLERYRERLYEEVEA